MKILIIKCELCGRVLSPELGNSFHVVESTIPGSNRLDAFPGLVLASDAAVKDLCLNCMCVIGIAYNERLQQKLKEKKS